MDRVREEVDVDALLRLGPVSIWETVSGFARHGEQIGNWSSDPDARDPEVVAMALERIRFLARTWFRLQVEGIENVPEDGPVMLVANHNGGILPMDSAFTVLALADRFGVGRPVHPLGHDLLGYDPTLRRWMQRFGVLRADPDSARRALEAGHMVLVYPGAAEDSWRTWTERKRVVLAQRRGFIRLALELGVPIVPVVSAGTHEQMIVLRSGRRLAKRLGLERRLRAQAFPIVFALPWGLTLGFFPYLPLPAQTTLRFGPPLRWDEAPAGAADDPAWVADCYRTIETTMQQMLDALYEGRVPILGQRRRQR